MDASKVKETREKFDKGGTWHWLSKNNSEIGMEALLCAAQNQFIRTIYIKYHIDKTSENPLCSLCGKKVKVYNTQSFDLRNFLRKNVNDDTTMTLGFKVKQQSTELPVSTDLETKRKLILKKVYKIPVYLLIVEMQLLIVAVIEKQNQLEIMDRNAVHVLKNLGKLN